jgi:homoserine kinase
VAEALPSHAETVAVAREIWCDAAAVRRGFVVRVPASSANLGSGFDAVAVALDTHLEVRDEGEPAPENHPAVRAFREAGGSGPISVAARFPGGRGLGYSGAARIGGICAAWVQQRRSLTGGRADVLRMATELEGHADNAAASLHGGVIAVAGGRAVRVPIARELAVVVWIPNRETATTGARRLLPEQVSFADAAFNVGRAALLVAALAAGDVDALRVATEDRLHQDRRLAHAPDTHAAIDAAVRAGAFGAWLSGSGPAAAAFADPTHANDIAAALPETGRTAVLAIDDGGVHVSERNDE